MSIRAAPPAAAKASASANKQHNQSCLQFGAAKVIWPGCVTEMVTRLMNTFLLIASLETEHLQFPSLMQGKCHSHHSHCVTEPSKSILAPEPLFAHACKQVDVLVNACCLRPACLCYLCSQMMHNDEIPQLKSGSQRGVHGEAGLHLVSRHLTVGTRAWASRDNAANAAW